MPDDAPQLPGHIAAMERRYLAAVAEEYSTHDVLGIRDAVPFDEFYVRPRLARRQAEVAGAGMDSLDVLSADPRVLIVGDAGRGKSSLVRWLTYQAAVSAAGPGRDVMPVSVSARTSVELLLALSPVVAFGRVILFVDGLDEV